VLQRFSAYQKVMVAAVGTLSLLSASIVFISPGVASAAQGGTIKIGLITSLSGPEASTFANVPDGAQARIDFQNSLGGVNGERLQLITADDGGSATGALTAAKSLVSQGVSAIIPQDLFFFAAAPYVHQLGIPVIGAAQDGPEWANPKNKNMFGVFGVPAPGYPTTTSWGKYFKARGATKIGLLAYGESPASVAAAKGVAISAKKAGLKVAYENLSLPIATTNFGPIALAMKNAGVDALYGGILTSSELALLTALQQSSVTLKVPMLVGGISQSLLETPGLSSFKNLQVISQYAPVELNTPATKKFQSNMEKYVNFFQVPDIFVQGTYIAADMVIKGFQLAGPNATNAKVISTLRKVTNYNGAGLYPAPLNLTKQSGTNDVAGSGPAFCWYVLKIVNGKASMQQTSPVCGVSIPNSNTSAPTTG
jgi:branched-chain amino acid transport system substrate-binding protein